MRSTHTHNYIAVCVITHRVLLHSFFSSRNLDSPITSIKQRGSRKCFTICVVQMCSTLRPLLANMLHNYAVQISSTFRPLLTHMLHNTSCKLAPLCGHNLQTCFTIPGTNELHFSATISNILHNTQCKCAPIFGHYLQTSFTILGANELHISAITLNNLLSARCILSYLYEPSTAHHK